MSTSSPFGTWKSPITAGRVAAGSLRFDHLVVDGDRLYWAERRASEAGRSVVVCRFPDGRQADVTPPGFDVRTRVHEYGGAAYLVHDEVVYFSNFADQRLYRQSPGEPPQPLTASGCYYADACMDARRSRLVVIREDHRAEGEPVNTIAGVPLHGGAEQTLVSGADFYSDPTISPDGTLLVWLQWNHPDMPWDGTELRIADIRADGSLSASRLVAGGRQESIFQPAWSPGGSLYYVSDRTGFWNLYRASGHGLALTASEEPLIAMDAEFGKPQWTFSQSTYDVIDDHRIAATYTEHGRWYLGLVQIEPRAFEPVILPLEPTDGVRAAGERLFFIGGSAVHPPAVATVDLVTRTTDVIRVATADKIEAEWISPAEPVTFDSGGMPVHAFYYAPKSPEFEAPAGELPPLIVVSHGGPTAATSDVLDARVQFWTSRGFAILDVNYGGSTGFGREYRLRLAGQWGLVDVADCVSGAKHMAATGRADPRRLAIRGGSAGGYTTLAALTFTDVFSAGASHYGVSDLEVLARDTHKFESRYLDSLVGPYPAAADEYRRRSPIYHVDRLSSALILFQGLEDKVVPPNQAELMAEAVRRKGLPVAYVAFEGEQHGFRRAENIVRALEAELYFYGVVFGFTPADRIDPVPIDNSRT